MASFFCLYVKKIYELSIRNKIFQDIKSTRVGLSEIGISTIYCKKVKKHIQYIVDFWNEVCYNHSWTHSETRSLAEDSGIFTGLGGDPGGECEKYKENERRGILGQ